MYLYVMNQITCNKPQIVESCGFENRRLLCEMECKNVQGPIIHIHDNGINKNQIINDISNDILEFVYHNDYNYKDFVNLDIIIQGRIKKSKDLDFIICKVCDLDNNTHNEEIRIYGWKNESIPKHETCYNNIKVTLYHVEDFESEIALGINTDIMATLIDAQAHEYESNNTIHIDVFFDKNICRSNNHDIFIRTINRNNGENDFIKLANWRAV